MREPRKENRRLSALLGLGPQSEKMLNAAGIRDERQLRRIGALAAYTRVLQSGQRVSLNLLWALAGALSDSHWARLPRDERSSLLRQYDAWCDAERARSRSWR
jgi:DNA transformation protein and related proteins